MKRLYLQDLSPTATQAADAGRKRGQVMQEPTVQQMPPRMDAPPLDEVSIALALEGRANINGEVRKREEDNPSAQ